MKAGDKVIYKKMHNGHNRNLKKHLGETGTILYSNPERNGVEHCVDFDNRATFWIDERWLEAAA